MLFGSFRRPADPSNQIRTISRRLTAARILAVVLGGLLYMLALPPWNYSVLGLLAMVPLIMVIVDRKPLAAAFYAGLWSLTWTNCSYFWLREIHPAVPPAISLVASLWPLVWGYTVPWLWRQLAYPTAVRLGGAEAMRQYAAEKLSPVRILSLAALLAAWYVFLEFTRSTMFPWNNLSTTMWRNLQLLPLAAYAGQFGIGFLLATVSLALGLGLRFRNARGHIRALPALLALGTTYLLAVTAFTIRQEALKRQELRSFRAAAIQGDISQRRNADNLAAAEALDIYLDESKKLLQSLPPDGPERPAVLIWPETAVPYAFKAMGPVSTRFRDEVFAMTRQYRMPLLFGTIDFRRKAAGEYGITNSALLITPEAGEAARYDKTHRVPYGEYIPFRELLPQFIASRIDMNRDLFPGRDYTPVRLTPEVRAGIAICFESVFAYIAREEARRGANLLLVISNDAWYPTSSEPEQHLANAVLRSVETGLPSLRCGNNGGTLVIDASGNIRQILSTPGTGRMEIRRGRAAGVLEIAVPQAPEMTFYVRHGEWFIVLCGLVTLVGFALALQRFFAERQRYRTLLEAQKE